MSILEMSVAYVCEGRSGSDPWKAGWDGNLSTCFLSPPPASSCLHIPVISVTNMQIRGRTVFCPRWDARYLLEASMPASFFSGANGREHRKTMWRSVNHHLPMSAQAQTWHLLPLASGHLLLESVLTRKMSKSDAGSILSLIATTLALGLLSADPNHPCNPLKVACSHSCQSIRPHVFVSTQQRLLNKYVLGVRQKAIHSLTIPEGVNSKTETEEHLRLKWGFALKALCRRTRGIQVASGRALQEHRGKSKWTLGEKVYHWLLSEHGPLPVTLCSEQI